MFVSVKERARQIANGQFSVIPSGDPVASVIDLAPEPNQRAIATARISFEDAHTKVNSQQSCPPNSKLSKVAPHRDAASEAACSKRTSAPVADLKTTHSGVTSPPEVSTSKRSPSKPILPKELSKPLSPKVGFSKPASSSKSAPQAKVSSVSKPASSTRATSPAKSTGPKRSSSSLKTKHAKSRAKRVDSPIEDDDPFSSLTSACLKQVSGVTGLGGRRLAIVLKQRSSGEWYAALKDTGSDKYLKLWTNKEKTFRTKEEALEAYLVFATKARNEVRWFPMIPRVSSPKAKRK